MKAMKGKLIKRNSLDTSRSIRKGHFNFERLKCGSCEVLNGKNRSKLTARKRKQGEPR